MGWGGEGKARGHERKGWGRGEMGRFKGLNRTDGHLEAVIIPQQMTCTLYGLITAAPPPPAVHSSSIPPTMHNSSTPPAVHKQLHPLLHTYSAPVAHPSCSANSSSTPSYTPSAPVAPPPPAVHTAAPPPPTHLQCTSSSTPPAVHKQLHPLLHLPVHQ